MSIELCEQTGIEAASVLSNKIADADLSVTVGGVAIDHIVRVSHAGDGLTVIEALSEDDTRLLFQFAPDADVFAKSAVDADGKPICEQC